MIVRSTCTAFFLGLLLVGPGTSDQPAAGSARGGVVINEILYHAPDDLDDLQFVELHNAGDKAVDLGGWKFSRGIKYEFPAGTRIAADGFLVVCKNLAEFKKHYGFEAAGQFTGALSHGSEHLELVDKAGKKIESIKYGSRAPWPTAADGYSSSLERICPTASGSEPANWAPSPLPAGPPKPSGTPGKKNANHAPRPLPVVSDVVYKPTHAAANQEVTVEATVTAADKLAAVELRYRLAGSGYEKEEITLPMTRKANGRYTATIPGQTAGQIIRFRIRARDAAGSERLFPSEHELRPAYSVYVHDKLQVGRIPLGYIINVGTPEFRAAQREAGGRALNFIFGGQQNPPPAPVRGRTAFVYVSPKTGEPELFDFVNVTPRTGGRKIRFTKDHALDGMTTINLIFEYMDRFVLAEPLAYEVYRKAGNAAPRTDFVRTFIDGRALGYQLLVEQPNKAFLRHNQLRTDGNLYKCVWYGQGVVGTHEKKTHIHGGHDDVVQLVEQLNRTRDDEQWALIKKHFDVEQVINYFAVNMVLSHWDGYFNNYFAYHDVHGTGKWTMYPWDQDKTWGFHDGIRGYEVFYDMPLSFGMEGDAPPGWGRKQPPPGFFGVGPVWWRPGGQFSKPLLANPKFRKLFLARTRELLDKVYTEEVFFPLIEDLGKRLEDEVVFRAETQKTDPKQALVHLRRNLDSLRDHLTRRRAFLLEQEDLKKAGRFDRTELK